MKSQQSLKLRLNIVSNWDYKIKKSKKSISQIAKLANVTRATIHNALNGSRLPNFTTINKVEEVLND